MGTLLIRATRRLSRAHYRFIRPVPMPAAGAVAEVYRQIEADFGMLAPPVALHASSPDVLAACWHLLRAALLVPGPAGRAEKEVVASAVSVANACPYCVEVHGDTLLGLRDDPDTRAITAGRIADVNDAALVRLARWAAGSGPAAGSAPPFPAAQAAQLLAVALTFHYINRMVSTFLTESPLPPVPGPMRAAVRWVAVRVMGSLARQPVQAAAPATRAPLPDDLGWARADAGVADAVAHATEAMERAGRRSVPASVRELLTARLADPHAEPPGLLAGPWLDEATAALPAGDRAAGRFALLVAYASYRVTPAEVAPLQAAGAGDASLVELAAWSAFTAARRFTALMDTEAGLHR